VGVDLRTVARSVGDGVRLSEEHVKAFLREGGAPAGTNRPGAGPDLPDFTKWGPVERVPFSSLQRKTAEQLGMAWSVAPHVTQFDTADVTGLEALRKRYRQTAKGGTLKLTVTAFVLRALVSALKAYPQFNASLDTRKNELILKRYYHIGVAVDTESGLIVPVLRDVDRKGVLVLAEEMNEIAERTRQRKIAVDELRGGTFTVTNLGGIGGTAFTPILNYPEVAILGLARSREEPVVRDGALATRLVLPLCLSYDHRVINGADGARFIRKVAALLEDPELLLLDG
jgi:pyruvate dehydrogenase E2 component (dihydrolipoamide acetyltransferase)